MARRAADGANLVRDADRILASRFAPPGVLVSADLDILHYRGNTEAYLTPAPGRASLNLVKMLREGLLVPVQAAVQRAAREGSTVRETGARVKSDGRYCEVVIEVVPVKGSGPPDAGFLILFEEAGKRSGIAPRHAPEPPAAVSDTARLEQELAGTREYLQSVIEQQEAANEELQSANEEVQSANEELQSLNEELETSKEEIQSTNEELVTVNDELNNRLQELNRLNNDLVNLVGSSQMAIVTVGPDLRVRRVTPAAEKLLNLIPTDVGRPLADIKINLDGMPDLESLMGEVIATLTVKDCAVRDKHGRWYSLRLSPYRTLDNKIDGVVMVLVDVDAMKRAHEYAESIVATVREPLLVLDSELRVQTASRAFYETFHVPPEKTIGRLLYDLGNRQWDIPALRTLLEEILPRNQRLEDFEVEHVFEHLGKRTMLLNARQLLQGVGGGLSILLAIEDITERKRGENALREIDRRRNEFLAMLAHELRNPLGPIGSAAQILKLRADESVAPTVDMIERQVAHMVRLVDDLLDVSRISRGRIELRRERMELASAVNDAVATALPLCERENHKLTVSLPSEPLYLFADATRVTQLVGNLLNNASKYTARGGRISLTVAREGNEAVIRVRDNGIGIEAAHLESVFDMFMQVDTALERSAGGLGIGLAMVKYFVEMHGGTVGVRSAGLDRGSEFEVRMPLSVEKGEPVAPASAASAAAGARNYRILVADDNRDQAESLAMLLRMTGHETHVAHDGLAAVEAAKTLRPEVVLLDIGMPKLNGYEAARKIREEPWGKNVVLIALTGWGQEQDRKDSRDAGFNHHIVKPVELAALMAFLSEIGTR